MKKLVCLAVIAMMFSFKLDAVEMPVEELNVDPCYAFATSAANLEWDRGYIDTNGEYYDSWNYWYDQCDTGF